MTDGELGKPCNMKPVNQTPVKVRRKFDTTFKREAVNNWLASGKAAGVVAQELGLRPSRLYAWKARFAPAAAGGAGIVLLLTRTSLLACAALFAPLPFLAWGLGEPLTVIGYAVGLTCLVGLTHLLTTRGRRWKSRGNLHPPQGAPVT